MRTLKIITIVLLISISTACNRSVDVQRETNNDLLLAATLYQQTAAEYRALCYQAYNIAAERLDEFLADSSFEKPLAIVVDVDETVLDNSPFEAKSILENSDYPTYWAEWCEKASADAIPGALEFLNSAATKGVETFYITNRKVEFLDVTMKNLQDKGFPWIDKDHMLFRNLESNKETRRQEVLGTHEIVLLVGDNLNDFSVLFEGNSRDERFQNVNKLRAEFGKRFILLPNAMYGGWLDALIVGENLTKEEKLAIMKNALIKF